MRPRRIATCRYPMGVIQGILIAHLVSSVLVPSPTRPHRIAVAAMFRSQQFGGASHQQHVALLVLRRLHSPSFGRSRLGYLDFTVGIPLYPPLPHDSNKPWRPWRARWTGVSAPRSGPCTAWRVSVACVRACVRVLSACC